MKVHVTVYQVDPPKELHTFSIDPSKTTYVLPPESKVGFKFSAVEEQSDED